MSLHRSLTVLLVVIAGMAAAEWTRSSDAFRHTLGGWMGRGDLLAVVHGVGLYRADLDRAADELRHRRGDGENDDDLPGTDHQTIAAQLVAGRAIEYLARRENVPAEKVNLQIQLLQSQKPEQWLAVLRGSALTPRPFRSLVRENLRAEQWLQRELERSVRVTADECRQHYQKNTTAYLLPMRWRVGHIFMAAPPVTPEEAAETKRIAMEAVSARIVGGEKFEDLVLDNSEDEATKESAGDLGYFSEMRMPPDFLAAVRGLRVGEVSKVVQTYLGFHIIQLLEIQPERQLSFEEAQEEISGLLSARKRAQAVVELTARVGREADFAQFVR